MVPTFTTDRSTGSAPSFSPAGLSTATPQAFTVAPDTRHVEAVSLGCRGSQRTAIPALIHQVRAGPRSLGGSTTGFCTRTPLRLASRTRTIWQCWPAPALSRLLPPFPTSPGSGCLQLQRPAATGRRWVLTPHPVTWRLVAHPPVARFQGHLRVRAGLGQLPQPSATGSLSMRHRPSTSPSSVIRTITDRRRCRSIPTYCRCCCIGVLLRREGLGWEAPSVPTLGPLRRGEAPPWPPSPLPQLLHGHHLAATRAAPTHPQPPAKHIAIRAAALQQSLTTPRALIYHQGRHRFQLFDLTPSAPTRTQQARHAKAAQRFFMTSARRRLSDHSGSVESCPETEMFGIEQISR